MCRIGIVVCVVWVLLVIALTGLPACKRREMMIAYTLPACSHRLIIPKWSMNGSVKAGYEAAGAVARGYSIKK